MLHLRLLLLCIPIIVSHSFSQAWYRLYGFQSATNGINALRCDRSGNLRIAGFHYDSLGIFDTVLRSNGSSDCFFLQTDDSGHVLTSYTFGGSGKDAIGDLAVKPDGHIIITGTFQKTMSLGTAELTAPTSESFFIAEFTDDATPVWTNVNSAYYGTALACNADNTIAVAGQLFDTAVIVPGDTLFGRGEQDLFLALYSGDGSPQWAIGAGGTTLDHVSAVEFTARDRIALAAGFRDTLYFSDTLFAPASIEEQGIVAVFDTAGNPVWYRPLLSDGTVLLRSITSDSSGMMYLTGRFSGSMTIDTATLVSTGEFSLFIACLQPDGTILWTHTSELVDANDIVVGEDNNLYLSGNFKKNALFGDSLYDAYDIEDVYLSSYTRDGTFRWVSTAGGCRASYGRKAVFRGNHCYIAGSTDADLISKSCTMQFDRLDLSYAQSDRGRTFIAFLDHTLPPGSMVRNPPSGSHQVKQASATRVRCYDLLGREITGILSGFSGSRPHRPLSPYGVVIEQRSENGICTVHLR
ncbi:MAG: hypothetical protein JW863_17385 [Chitinispirillaceae bacterium]|nr:hypothetical protein [Chitinispirillaceae bacterium]